jgi:hypothetical protein
MAGSSGTNPSSGFYFGFYFGPSRISDSADQPSVVSKLHLESDLARRRSRSSDFYDGGAHGSTNSNARA